MFLPLLDESEKSDGAGMIGALVKVYTADLKLHLYQINIVKRHATDLSLAFDLAPGEHRLIMQTSEGPHGTVPKLQVAAKPLGVYVASAAEALRPRISCATRFSFCGLTRSIRAIALASLSGRLRSRFGLLIA